VLVVGVVLEGGGVVVLGAGAVAVGVSGNCCVSVSDVCPFGVAPSAVDATKVVAAVPKHRLMTAAHAVVVAPAELQRWASV
jgi:hypothetical protein